MADCRPLDGGGAVPFAAPSAVLRSSPAVLSPSPPSTGREGRPMGSELGLHAMSALPLSASNHHPTAQNTLALQLHAAHHSQQPHSPNSPLHHGHPSLHPSDDQLAAEVKAKAASLHSPAALPSGPVDVPHPSPLRLPRLLDRLFPRLHRLRRLSAVVLSPLPPLPSCRPRSHRSHCPASRGGTPPPPLPSPLPPSPRPPSLLPSPPSPPRMRLCPPPPRTRRRRHRSGGV